MKVYVFCLILMFFTGCGQFQDLIDTVDSEVSGNDVGNSGSSSGNTSCGNMNTEACEAFNLVNLQRINNGVPPLEISGNCVDVAQYHAEDMDQNNYFSHDGLNESWSERFTRFGVSGRRGENIAQTGSEAVGAVEVWMNSQGHRDNILDSRYRFAGVGYSGGLWVQCFN